MEDYECDYRYLQQQANENEFDDIKFAFLLSNPQTQPNSSKALIYSTKTASNKEFIQNLTQQFKFIVPLECPDTIDLQNLSKTIHIIQTNSDNTADNTVWMTNVLHSKNKNVLYEYIDTNEWPNCVQTEQFGLSLNRLRPKILKSFGKILQISSLLCQDNVNEVSEGVGWSGLISHLLKKASFCVSQQPFYLKASVATQRKLSYQQQMNELDNVRVIRDNILLLQQQYQVELQFLVLTIEQLQGYQNCSQLLELVKKWNQCQVEEYYPRVFDRMFRNNQVDFIKCMAELNDQKVVRGDQVKQVNSFFENQVNMENPCQTKEEKQDVKTDNLQNKIKKPIFIIYIPAFDQNAIQQMDIPNYSLNVNASIADFLYFTNNYEHIDCRKYYCMHLSDLVYMRQQLIEDNIHVILQKHENNIKDGLMLLVNGIRYTIVE